MKHLRLMVQRIVKDPDRPLEPLPRWWRVLLSRVAPRWWRRHLAAEHARRVRRARERYPATLVRIRTKARAGQPLNVLFIVQSSAKWKCQSLYDSLRTDARFNLRIGLSQPTLGPTATPRQLAAAMEQMRAFFTARGCEVVEVYNPWKDVFLDLAKRGVDLVFYPESWYQPLRHSPEAVARFALTYYIPYFVQDYGSLETNCLLPIFQLYHRYIIQNDEWAAIFKAALVRAGHDLAGDIVGLGHPMLDLIRFAPEDFDTVKRLKVVYAPHWTVEIPGEVEHLKYATFRENGREILAYAQRHPEIDWVFRPHPRLKRQLLQCDFMTPAEVEAYYAAWTKLGTYSTGGGYEKMFDVAQAMITDCGSFLAEFGATGRPIVHLICASNPLVPLPPSKRVFDTYYQVHNLDELGTTLHLVLEQRQDPLRARRVQALTEARLVGSHAGKTIHDALVAELIDANR